MPIRADKKHRYPANWKEISARIIERAKHRCELCFAPNAEMVYRNTDGRWHLHKWEADMRPVKIVLTVAHLDPTYSCHDDACLLALCQRCHLKIDIHLRRHKGKKS